MTLQFITPRGGFGSFLVGECEINPSFVVGKFDAELRGVTGKDYGLYNSDRVYCCLLFDDEIQMNGGRFENFQYDMLAFDHSIVEPGKQTENLFDAASEIDKPWSFRLVYYHGIRRYTFSFQDDITAVEFKLRIA